VLSYEGIVPGISLILPALFSLGILFELVLVPVLLLLNIALVLAIGCLHVALPGLVVLLRCGLALGLFLLVA